jgi:hypothetical protein
MKDPLFARILLFLVYFYPDKKLFSKFENKLLIDWLFKLYIIGRNNGDSDTCKLGLIIDLH